MGRVAASDEMLCACACGDTGLRVRRRPRDNASTEVTVFHVAAVAVQDTFLTRPDCAGAVAQLLVSTGPALSLPGRLCIVGAVAVQKSLWFSTPTGETSRWI